MTLEHIKGYVEGLLEVSNNNKMADALGKLLMMLKELEPSKIETEESQNDFKNLK